jgi:hypothetical protein
LLGLFLRDSYLLFFFISSVSFFPFLFTLKYSVYKPGSVFMQTYLEELQRLVLPHLRISIRENPPFGVLLAVEPLTGQRSDGA